MEHTHKAETTRNLPFGGVTLSVCSCGARKMSNGNDCGGTLDTDGWYVMTQPTKEQINRRAYDLLQNEGYEPERPTEDIIDGINSNIPNID